MASLTKTAFLSKWASLFADNSTRNISEEDMRDFRQDIADSFLNTADRNVSTAMVIMSDYDASTNLFPGDGSGSASDGSIKKGDTFPVIVAGTPGGFLADVGTWLVSRTNSPGQTVANWRFLL